MMELMFQAKEENRKRKKKKKKTPPQQPPSSLPQPRVHVSSQGSSDPCSGNYIIQRLRELTKLVIKCTN